MEKYKRLLLLLMVSVVLSLSSIFYLTMQNMELRRDLYTMESQFKGSDSMANCEAAKALGNEIHDSY